MNVHMNAGYLKAEIARLIDAYPELAEDETLRADMIDGETDLNRVIGECLGARRESETMVTAISLRIGDLAERKARYQRKADAMKALIQSIMESAGLHKLALPEATLSILSGRTSVNVTDVNELPQGFYSTERKADKKALKSALEKGEAIPGAELVMGEDTLTVRVK